MKSFIKAMNDLPKILKLILALPGIDLIWNIYRACKSLQKGNLIHIIIGIIIIIVGWAFMWIIDLVTILLSDKVVWID